MAVPTFGAAGTGAATTSSSSISVPYPSGIVAGQLLILHVQNFNGTSITTPTDWTFIDGSAIGRAYWKVATGSESGSLSVSGSFGFLQLTMGRMYSFDGVDTTTPEEGSATHSDSGSSTINDEGVTTTGADRLAINLIGLTSGGAGAPSQSNFTGETGGDWTEPTAEYTTTTGDDGSMGIQTASMASAGTINGGTFTASVFASGARVIGFALLPGAPTLVKNGSITPTGALVKDVARRWAGTLAPAGALTRRQFKSANNSGSLTPAGTVRKKTAHRESGSVGLAGAVSMTVGRRTFLPKGDPVHLTLTPHGPVL